MNLDRGTLERIDRKLLAGLDGDEEFRMVRVPATEAKWSTWKRYCDSAGISMGRAILVLIERELVSVFGEPSDGEIPVLAAETEARLADREARIGKRESTLVVTEARLRECTNRLRRREDELRGLEERVEVATKMAAQAMNPGPKVGRNERCPCGSGLKFKRCHGDPERARHWLAP